LCYTVFIHKGIVFQYYYHCLFHFCLPIVPHAEPLLQSCSFSFSTLTFEPGLLYLT
jgi:hypothetical protein